MIRSTRTGRYIKQPKKTSLKDLIFSAVLVTALTVMTGYAVGHSFVVEAETEKSPLATDYVTPSVTPSPSPTVTATPSPVQAAVVSSAVVGPLDGVVSVNSVLEQILPITRKYGIPDQLTVAQWAVESGRATYSPINNYFGIGPHIPYPSIEANAHDYALTVVNIARKNGCEVKDGKTASEILNALQTGRTRYEAHNPDPMTYVWTVTNTPEWRSFE